MKQVRWGIQGYLVVHGHKVIGQFENCGWAVEFQRMVAHQRKGQYVTLLADDCNSTMIIEDKEEDTTESKGGE